MKFLGIISSAALLGCGVVLLYIFLSIAYLGVFLVQEPNAVILVVEIGLSCAIIILGLWGLVENSK